MLLLMLLILSFLNNRQDETAEEKQGINSIYWILEWSAESHDVLYATLVSIFIVVLLYRPRTVSKPLLTQYYYSISSNYVKNIFLNFFDIFKLRS